MRQISIVISSVLMTGLILLGFQNCGQPGQLAQVSSTNPTSVSSSLEVGAPSTGGAPVSPSDASPTSGSSLPPPESTVIVNDPVQAAICRDMTASDVMLNVDQVASDGASFGLIDADHFISIVKAAVNLKATSSGDVSEIRIILNPLGNLVLGSDNVAYDLKTPSAQSSGFKVRLASRSHVVEGKIYSLTLNIDLSHQIVRAGKKCLLKPEIHNAVLTSI